MNKSLPVYPWPLDYTGRIPIRGVFEKEIGKLCNAVCTNAPNRRVVFCINGKLIGAVDRLRTLFKMELFDYTLRGLHFDPQVFVPFRGSLVPVISVDYKSMLNDAMRPYGFDLEVSHPTVCTGYDISGIDIQSLAVDIKNVTHNRVGKSAVWLASESKYKIVLFKENTMRILGDVCDFEIRYKDVPKATMTRVKKKVVKETCFPKAKEYFDKLDNIEQPV